MAVYGEQATSEQSLQYNILYYWLDCDTEKKCCSLKMTMLVGEVWKLKRPTSEKLPRLGNTALRSTWGIFNRNSETVWNTKVYLQTNKLAAGKAALQSISVSYINFSLRNTTSRVPYISTQPLLTLRQHSAPSPRLNYGQGKQHYYWLPTIIPHLSITWESIIRVPHSLQGHLTTAFVIIQAVEQGYLQYYHHRNYSFSI